MKRQIQRSGLRGSRILMFAGGGLMAIAAVVVAPSSKANPVYSPGCTGCHGDFLGPASPKGTIFPEDNKHQMHRGSAYMDADCFLCHTQIGDNPMLGSSAGTANNPGLGCGGCHDAVGLRRHHLVNGILSCQECHPNDPEPDPENTQPVYYGTVDTNADDPCNAGPLFLENWSIGDTEGLDNDGDNLYDGADPDCGSTVCEGDSNNDGVVNVTDLVNVIGAWGGDGQGPGFDADLNNDGVVNVSDLILVISGWGVCP